MDRWNKIENIVGAAVFGALGIVALVVATFFGATHQYAMAGIGLFMAAVLTADAIPKERKVAIKKQLATAISCGAYPTAHIPMAHWAWHWDKRGNVKYRQWRTLWNYITAKQ